MNLRFTSDNLYPAPTSWKSSPDSVVPSQLKAAEIVAGVPGPVSRSNRDNIDPTPLFSECCDSSVNFHRIRFVSAILKDRQHDRMRPRRFLDRVPLRLRF